MKITKTANNKKRITISRSEWQSIGKKAGWIKDEEKECFDKDNYDDFFKTTLDKFGVKSVDDLDEGSKKKFFDYIDENWKAKDEVCVKG